MGNPGVSTAEEMGGSRSVTTFGGLCRVQRVGEVVVVGKGFGRGGNQEGRKWRVVFSGKEVRTWRAWLSCACVGVGCCFCWVA